ncbi:hypothetical protein BKA70DRAFT_1287225 [Coprinopsis sp. MPI-PUGE-AT-0042]|nr:hypothetical protein BKA70DRAFT_1287225 [Coprinopsis sp. MPI-PUGE-AT-0042]
MEAERERQRLAQEEADRQRQRLADEEAERERQRLVEEEAERERQRLAEEAEQERQRLLDEEEAERERVRLEEEQIRIQREKDEEEERARKAREKEQERQWKLEHAERKTELAAAASEVKRAASVVSAAGSRMSKVDKDKDLPPPPGAAIEEPVVRSQLLPLVRASDISWRPEGIGAGGRSEVGRSVVGQEKDQEDAAEEEEEDANEPEGPSCSTRRPCLCLCWSPDATEVSQEVEKRLRKALSLRAQKAELDHQLQALQAKPDAGADEIKAAERVVRKYEKKIRRLYEDCQAQSFFYPSAEAASAILLQGISPELARDHINEALLWHLTPEARSLSFTVSLPLKSTKTSGPDKAMRTASLSYMEKELKLTRTVNRSSKRLHTIAVESNRWDEWIATLRRASTSADS